MNLKKMKLDTTSEYIIDNGRSLNVMVEGIGDDIKPIMGIDNVEIDYVDAYVHIDPILEIVTRVEYIVTYADDTKGQLDINVSTDEGIELFYILMSQDNDNYLAKFIKSAKDMYHQERMERVGCIIDTFDDFLEEKDIYIPSSVREMSDAGDSVSENHARIYGNDYDKLSADIKIALDEDDLTIAEKWWKLHFNFAAKSAGAVDEVDFVSHAIEDYGITGDFILYRIQDLEACQWFRRVAEEHGII